MTTATATYPDLPGRVALVTGGSRGIGAATCTELAANGARVAVCGRDEGAARKVADEIRGAGGSAMVVLADCTDAAALAQAREQVERELGPVDVLAAFAGGDGNPVPLAKMTPEDWRAKIEQELTSAFLTIHAFVPGMCERGRGSVITMSSSAGRQAGRTSPAYAAAKGAIVALTRHIAAEVGPSGVRVNCLAPSAILTEKNQQRIPEEMRSKMASQFPLQRLGTTADTAAAALFLASDASSWITGQTIDVAGGKTML